MYNPIKPFAVGGALCVLTAFFISCSKEQQEYECETVAPGYSVLAVLDDDMEGLVSDGKTYMDSDNASVLWSKGDRITAFWNNGIYPSKNTVSEEEAGTKNASFSFDGHDYTFAFYPGFGVTDPTEAVGKVSVSAGSESTVVTLPGEYGISSTQTAQVGSFGPGVNASVARIVSGGNWNFLNLGAALRIKLKYVKSQETDPSTLVFDYIELSHPESDDSRMAGTLTAIYSDDPSKEAFLVPSVSVDKNAADASNSVRLENAVGEEEVLVLNSGEEKSFYFIVAPGTYNKGSAGKMTLQLHLVSQDRIPVSKVAAYGNPNEIVLERNKNFIFANLLSIPYSKFEAAGGDGEVIGAGETSGDDL